MIKSIILSSCLFILFFVTACGGSSSGGGNSAPVISVNPTLVVPNMQENTVAVDTSNLTITDADNDPLTYSLTGGSDQSRFSINASSGALVFISAPDYETPTDSNTDNFYVVQISVSDGMASANTLFTVEVLNVNDNAPSFSSASSVAVIENSTAVSTVTVDDADGSSLFVQTFSLTGGDDQTSFAIDSSSGALSFINAPDFEIPSDADSNNIYLVEVTITDGAFIVSQSLEVTVTDVNEAQFGLTARPANTTCVLPDPPDLTTSLELNRVFTSLSFNRPIVLRQSPTVADRWYVAEQDGVIRTFLTNAAVSTVFADLTTPVSSASNEMGLLGMAFHPDFSNNNYIYVYYSNAKPK
jgi:hypothetical protein